MKDAPDKLKVSVNVADADWHKMQDLFDQEHKWMLGKMQENIRQVNAMFVEERRKVQKRYKEYDGCYLGHYAQWFFWFFFVMGFFCIHHRHSHDGGQMVQLVLNIYCSHHGLCDTIWEQLTH